MRESAKLMKLDFNNFCSPKGKLTSLRSLKPGGFNVSATGKLPFPRPLSLFDSQNTALGCGVLSLLAPLVALTLENSKPILETILRLNSFNKNQGNATFPSVSYSPNSIQI